LLLLFLLLTNLAVLAQPQPNDGSALFWAELQKLCGKAFAGTVAAAPKEDVTFKDKELVMYVSSCKDNVIRIPFVVGTDKSRTWILTKKNDRILLKHDHRHQDGKPEKITEYGGVTTNSGSADRQMFPADQHTVDLLPTAGASVWWIDLVPGSHFTYNLRQLWSEIYFSIRFDISKETSKPQGP
jgi:hypothetical protein